MRLGTKAYRQFVGIARGSAGEVCYQLLLAKDLQYIREEVYREIRAGYDRVVQMLSRLSQNAQSQVTSTTVSTNHDHGFLRHDHGSDTSTVFFRSRSRPFSDPRPRLLSLRATNTALLPTTKHEHESPSPGFFSYLSNIGLQSPPTGVR